jgi:hypothetical protein
VDAHARQRRDGRNTIKSSKADHIAFHKGTALTRLGAD